jgi:hypothetical protein
MRMLVVAPGRPVDISVAAWLRQAEMSRFWSGRPGRLNWKNEDLRFSVRMWTTPSARISSQPIGYPGPTMPYCSL